MDSCIFCKIIKGEIPSSKIYEDEQVLAFLDIGPVNKGHTLVIPKQHHETLMDIPDEILKQVIVVVKKACKAVKKGVKAEGISLGMSNYKSAGQVVPHAHFHIMPRFSEDRLKLWPQGKYEEGEMEVFREKIVSFLNE
jgi:histidine triad (HIT) family protein